MTEHRRGLALGAAAFTLWGILPVFWPLLAPATPVEVLAHRIIWSLVVAALLLVATKRVGRVREIWASPRVRLALTVAGVMICLNWGTYIWAVTNGFVVETSLGYYINPLVTVLLGVVFLRERLRRVQWAALGIAFIGVCVLTAQVQRPPWIALVLALTFGCYGLVKKKAAVGPIEGLTWEGLVMAPLAIGFLGWLTAVGRSTAVTEGPLHVALLMMLGIVTAVPLLCFAGAANRIPLTTIGVLQYIAPTLQLVLGVTWFGEPMGTLRWVGFGFVWLALAIFTAESLHASRRTALAGRHAAEAVEAGAVLDEACLDGHPIASPRPAAARSRP